MRVLGHQPRPAAEPEPSCVVLQKINSSTHTCMQMRLDCTAPLVHYIVTNVGTGHLIKSTRSIVTAQIEYIWTNLSLKTADATLGRTNLNYCSPWKWMILIWDESGLHALDSYLLELYVYMVLDSIMSIK